MGNNIILNKITTILLIIISVILSFFLAKKMFIIILPFIIGYLISKLFIPIMNILKIKNKYLKSFIIFILIILFISTISFLLLILIRNSTEYISLNIIENNRLQESIITFYNDFTKNTINLPLNFSFKISEAIDQIIVSVNSYVTSKSQIFVEHSFKLIRIIPELLIFIIITCISSFFFTKDNELIKKKKEKYFSKYFSKLKSNEYYIILKNDILKVILGYIKAQLILMTITFSIASFSLLIIGIEKPFLKAFFISFLDALPIFGTAIILVPWAILKLITSQYTLGISLLIIYIILTTTRQSLEPKIFSTQIGLYPLITLFSIYTGLKLIGVLGIFIGPILIISIQTLIKKSKKHERF